jgi:hypothetical protein
MDGTSIMALDACGFSVAPGRGSPSHLKKSATVYIARFSWVALPLTEARERLIGRSERSIFWQAVG